MTAPAPSKYVNNLNTQHPLSMLNWTWLNLTLAPLGKNMLLISRSATVQAVSLGRYYSVAITQLLDTVAAVWHARPWQFFLTCLVSFKLLEATFTFRWWFSSSIARLILLFASQSITNNFLWIPLKQSCAFCQKDHNIDCRYKSIFLDKCYSILLLLFVATNYCILRLTMRYLLLIC